MTLRLSSSLPLGMCGVFFVLVYLNILIPSIAAVDSDVHNTYDFIVVGSGSAGAVVANRLSEKPQSYKVLLIEAGGQETPVSRIPFISTTVQLTPMNWGFVSEPQEFACLGLKDKRSTLPAGKSLGGSSAINTMLYVRANHRDYDLWASHGNYGWAWEDVFPYFLKSEGNLNLTYANDAYHNDSGLLKVSDVPYKTRLLPSFLEACQAQGVPLRDINAEFQTGVMPVQTNTFKGKRFSTNSAFITTASKRTNMKIKTHAIAEQVIFDSDKRATGVVYVRNGIKYIAKATKEVILSAGAMNTPKLLMLSGIGPKEHLDELNIKTIVDLPGVGQNFLDHVWFTGLTFTIETDDSISLLESILPHNLLGYALFGNGPLSTPSGVESTAFFNTIFADQNEDFPDVQILLNAVSPLTDYGIGSRTVFGFSDETWDKYFAPHLGKHSFSMLPYLLRPKSRGYLKLRSKNPNDDPIIDPKYFSHPDDLKIMTEVLKLASTLANHTSFQKFGTKLIPSICPGCEMHSYLSEDYWTCFAQHFSTSAFHVAGSAKMGNSSDPMAVVDPELRVYGVKGLRVADCSIMPDIVSGNNHAPTVMIGEKASDMIKNTYN